MKRIWVIFALLLNILIDVACRADTNVLTIPKGDSRAGAVFFVDECLTRGLTNSISIKDLRKWATNTIQRYQSLETRMAKSTTAAKLNYSVAVSDIPNSIATIQTRVPSCKSTDAKPKSDGWNEILEMYSKAWAVSEEEAEARLRTIGPDRDPPKTTLWRSSIGTIEAVAISWHKYGIIVGPESFKAEWEPWYQRKLADGIYLWHGYK